MINVTVNGVSYPIPSSASDCNWAAQQVAFEQAVAAAVNSALSDIATLEGSTWLDITDGDLINSWFNTGGQSQRLKRAWGTVELRMHVDGGSDGTSCYQLPSGWRPPADIQLLVPAQNDTGVARVTILADGNIVITQSAGSFSSGVCIAFSFSTA